MKKFKNSGDLYKELYSVNLDEKSQHRAYYVDFAKGNFICSTKPNTYNAAPLVSEDFRRRSKLPQSFSIIGEIDLKSFRDQVILEFRNRNIDPKDEINNQPISNNNWDNMDSEMKLWIKKNMTLRTIKSDDILERLTVYFGEF